MVGNMILKYVISYITFSASVQTNFLLFFTSFSFFQTNNFICIADTFALVNFWRALRPDDGCKVTHDFFVIASDNDVRLILVNLYKKGYEVSTQMSL